MGAAWERHAMCESAFRGLTEPTGALHATRRREMDKPETSPTYQIPDPICQHKT